MNETNACGLCRDCKHWSPTGGTHGGCSGTGKSVTGHCSDEVYTLPDFGCVLFEARPLRRMAASVLLNADNDLIHPLDVAKNAVPIGPYTHYSVNGKHASYVHLVRFEEGAEG